MEIWERTQPHQPGSRPSLFGIKATTPGCFKDRPLHPTPYTAKIKLSSTHLSEENRANYPILRIINKGQNVAHEPREHAFRHHSGVDTQGWTGDMHRLETPLVRPFSSGWASGLFWGVGCYEYCCYEHLCACFRVDTFSISCIYTWE